MRYSSGPDPDEFKPTYRKDFWQWAFYIFLILLSIAMTFYFSPHTPRMPDNPPGYLDDPHKPPRR